MDVSNASEFRLIQALKQMKEITGAMENSSYKVWAFLIMKRR